MATIVLVAGPPFGPPLWDAVAQRLEHLGHRVQTHSLVGAVAGRDSVLARRDALAGALAGLDQPPVVVGHGLAVPVVLHLAEVCSLRGMVLSNGPIARLDPASRALARVAASPRLAARTVLHPVVLQRWLWSSAGLRRLVVNPYVMGRDTVVAVTGEALRSGAERVALAELMGSIAETVARPLPRLSPELPLLLLWGDDDRLYPPGDADMARAAFENSEQMRIPGGRHLHPIERPWELADGVDAWLQRQQVGAHAV